MTIWTEKNLISRLERMLLVLTVLFFSIPIGSILAPPGKQVSSSSSQPPQSGPTQSSPGSAVSISPTESPGSAGALSVSTATNQLLFMSMDENVSLAARGASSPFTALITIPAGRLAELYRKMFEAQSPKSPNLPIPLPEHTTSGENRSAFYRSMEQQQLYSLGLNSNISDSSLVPWTTDNGLNLWMQGSGTFLESVTPASSLDRWQLFVGVGKNATNAAVANFLTILILTRMMLRSTGQGAYEYDWNTRIRLPPGAVLLNGGHISGLAWNIDLGGGSHLTASVSKDDGGAVFLKEATVLTQGNLTATPEYLLSAFLDFENFEIDYGLPHTLFVDQIQPDFCVIICCICFDTGVVGFDIPVTLNPEIPPFKFSTNSLVQQITGLTASGQFQGSASFSLTPHFHLDVCGGILNPPPGCGLITLKELDASIDIDASASLLLQLNISGDTTKLTGSLWKPTVFDQTLWSNVINIGPVPVYVALHFVVQFDVGASLAGAASLSFGIDLGAHYSTGIMFDGQNWTSFGSTPSFTETMTGPTFQITAPSVSLLTGLRAKLQLLMWEAIGGYVGFEPYVRATLSCLDQPTLCWSITLGFKILVGVVFFQSLIDAIDSYCGVCASVLSFIPKDLSWPIFDQPLYTWSGTGPKNPAVSSTASSSSPIASAGRSFQVNGTVVDVLNNPVSGANVTAAMFGPVCRPFFENFTIPVFSLSNSTLFNATRILPIRGPVACPIFLHPPHVPTYQTLTDALGNYLIPITAPQTQGDYNIAIYVTPLGATKACVCASVGLNVLPPDTTPPIITPILTVRNFSNQAFTPNAAGWINGNLGNVTLAWHLNDTETGVGSSTGCGGALWYENNTVISETAGTRITCTATDRAGNAGSMTVIVRIARLPPVIIDSRTPGPNSQGWNNGNVTISFACSDRLSGVKVPPSAAPMVVSSEGFNQTRSATCTNVADITRSITVTGINIDKTPPTITSSASPAPNAHGWNNADVTVRFSCTDSLSGVLSVSSPVTLTTDGMAQSAAGSCTDKAGNTSHATLGGINIDKTPPVVSSLQLGQSFLRGQIVNASFNCTDATSGVALCGASVAMLDTSTVGIHSYTVSASDLAGNVATLAVNYNVFDFATTMAPYDRTVLRGSSTSYTVTTSLVPGSQGAPNTVGIVISDLPSDATLSAPSTMALPGAGKITIQTGATSLGDHGLTVTGSVPQGSRSGNGVLHIFDFTVTAPRSLTMLPTGKNSIAVTLTLKSGSSVVGLPTISLSDTSLPANATGLFTPSSGLLTFTSRFNVTTANAPAGNYTLTLTGSDSRSPEGGQRSISTKLVVLKPQQAIQLVTNQVNAFRSTGVLNLGQAGSLIAKLGHAIGELNIGDRTVACNQLTAFVNQVNSYVATGVLTQDQANMLLGGTLGIHAIMAAIPC